MANLTPQTVTVLGTLLTAVAPTATVGDTVPVGSRVTVRNGAGSPINVTLVTPGNDAYGTARPDVVVAVANGTAKAFGPMPADLGDPANSNLVTLICSSITTITLEVTSS